MNRPRRARPRLAAVAGLAAVALVGIAVVIAVNGVAALRHGALETPAPNAGRTDRSLSPSPTDADLLPGEADTVADLLDQEADDDLLRELNTPELPLR